MGIVIETDVKKIRKRTWHYISPEVAACAGMTVADQQQFIAHQYTPTPEQLRCLALRMGMIERVS